MFGDEGLREKKCPIIAQHIFSKMPRIKCAIAMRVLVNDEEIIFPNKRNYRWKSLDKYHVGNAIVLFNKTFNVIYSAKLAILFVIYELYCVAVFERRKMAVENASRVDILYQNTRTN